VRIVAIEMQKHAASAITMPLQSVAQQQQKSLDMKSKSKIPANRNTKMNEEPPMSHLPSPSAAYRYCPR
jgi:hypothetical protein